MSAIFRLFDSETGRSLRSTSASGWMPMERSAATECYERHQADVDEEHVGPAELVAHLARRLDERLRLDVADRAADLRDDDVGRVLPVRAGLRLQPHAPLDLVGDVRDDLHGVAEVLAPPLPRDDLRVDLARRDVRRLVEADVEEALVVADVEVRLGAVVGHEDLAVLERVHRPRVDIEVGVELLHDDAQPPRGQQIAETRGGETFAQRGDDAPGDEDVLRHIRPGPVRSVHHGIPA